jgi:hypothetical protein
MNKMMIGLMSVFSFLIMLTSCDKENSADVNQDKIYTEYELFYNANSDKTVAIARLRFGGPTGTLLEATTPAGVTFNGEILPYSAVYSGHAKEFAGKITTGTFAYTNTENTVYTNTPPVMDTMAHPAGFTTIDKSVANTYAWIGNPLTASERVNLFVGSWTWGQDAIFFASGAGANNIVMGVNQMTNLAEGSSTLYVDRVNETTSIQGTSEGGVIRTRFRPLNVQVNVVP